MIIRSCARASRRCFARKATFSWWASPPTAWTRSARSSASSPTRRERQVLHLTAEGQSSEQVAKRLFISPRTVESHRTNLMHKLGVHNQRELIQYVLKRGILLRPPEGPFAPAPE